MIKYAATSLLAISLILPISSPALAQGYDDAISAEILPGWRRADGRHVAAVRMVLKDGWKTYWRAPGDGGIPPQVRWSGSRNLDNVNIVWPTPNVFSQNGMRSIGYENEVIVPLIVSPSTDGNDVKLKARLDIGVCKDICIPETLRVSAELPAASSEIDPRIAVAMTEQPYSAQEAGVSQVSCALSATSDGMIIKATINMPSTGGAEHGVIETNNPKLWVAEAETVRRGNTITIASQVMHVDEEPFLVDRSGVRVTIFGHDYAVDIQGCPTS